MALRKAFGALNARYSDAIWAAAADTHSYFTRSNGGAWMLGRPNQRLEYDGSGRSGNQPRRATPLTVVPNSPPAGKKGYHFTVTLNSLEGTPAKGDYVIGAASPFDTYQRTIVGDTLTEFGYDVATGDIRWQGTWYDLGFPTMNVGDTLRMYFAPDGTATCDTYFSINGEGIVYGGAWNPYNGDGAWSINTSSWGAVPVLSVNGNNKASFDISADIGWSFEAGFEPL